MKITIIGAGSTYTPELIEGIIDRMDSLYPTEICLMDIDARKLRIVGGLSIRMVENSPMKKCKVVLTDDVTYALTGASYVMGQIRVGKLGARHLDELLPLKYDLLGQETTGIGGFFKGQRTIPVILDIAKKMEMLCPDAWLINFSNPSGMVSEALAHHSNIRSLGLCNCPFNMMKSVKESFPLLDPKFEFVGLNHLSWITSIMDNGHDYIEDAIKLGFNTEGMTNIPTSGFPPELIRQVKAIPTSYFEYIYFPSSKVKKLQQAKKTRAQECMEIEENLLAMYEDASLHVKPDLLSKRGGANYSLCAISLVDALHNDLKEMHVVNTPNLGVLPFLDSGDVAEIATIVGKNGVTPLPITHADNPHIISMTRQFKAYEKLAVQAAVYGDRDAAMLALMANPLVQDYDKAKACFEDLLIAHRDYLPQYFTHNETIVNAGRV